MSQSTNNDEPDRKAERGQSKDSKVEDAEVVTPETAEAGAADRDAEGKDSVDKDSVEAGTEAATQARTDAESADDGRAGADGLPPSAAVAMADQIVHDAPVEETAGEAHLDEHHGGSTLAGMALRFLIIVLVVFGLSLWLVPMIAPHMPASIARHIMPGQKQLDERLATLDEEVRARTEAALSDVARMDRVVAELTKRLAEAEAAAAKARDEASAAREEAARSAKAATTATMAEEVVTEAQGAAREASAAAETATTAATEAGKVAAAATRDAASLARRMTSFEAQLAALSDQIGAMGEALARAPASDGGATPELAAAFAALKAKVDDLAERAAGEVKYLTAEDADRFATQDDLRSARTALEAQVKTGLAALPAPGDIATDGDLASLKEDVDGRLGAIDARVAAAEKAATSASEAASAASAASAKAAGRVEDAIRDASVRSAVAALMSRLDNGVSYASALDELEKLTGRDAPEELRAPAPAGVATADELRRSFGRKAQEAISADIRSAAEDDGVLGKASARLRSVVAGRPKNAEEGDDTPAVISRMEAKLRDGALEEALSESQALSEPARAAMADWLSRLSARVAADRAAAAYIDELTRQQG